jgi:hypothetical protein
VTHLVITRPPNFKFKSGDYIFIRIPSITRYEWHPFTISSSPDLTDYLWLHVRSLGNWTKKLNEYCSEFAMNNLNKCVMKKPSFRNNGTLKKKTKLIRKMSTMGNNLKFKDLKGCCIIFN